MYDGEYSRECHLRYVLSRLKCILKGNRERRCNFPRETEHEIKRGCCAAAAHSLAPSPFLLSRPSPSHPSPALIRVASLLLCTIRLSDTSRFILPFGCPRRSSTKVLTIIFPGERRNIPFSHFSPLPCSFSRVQSPVRYTRWH